MWRRQVLQPMLVLSRVPRLPQTSHSAREPTLPEVAGVTGVEGTCGVVLLRVREPVIGEAGLDPGEEVAREPQRERSRGRATMRDGSS
jgi:hypothetical protein